MTDRMDLQNAEFDALRKLRTAFDYLCRVPIVDDYYPEVRHRYECALDEFLTATLRNRMSESITWSGLQHRMRVAMNTPFAFQFSTFDI